MNKVVFFSIFGIVVSESGEKYVVWWWDRTKSDLIAIFCPYSSHFLVPQETDSWRKNLKACGTNKLKIKINKQNWKQVAKRF